MAELSDDLLAQLNARLAPRGLTQLRPLVGGASSLTYRGYHDGRQVVVKVAPPGIEPTRHRDVLRQSRIIRALDSTPVPVPEVLWEDTGDPPEVPPLFVMSLVDGISVEPLFDSDVDIEPDSLVAQRFQSAAACMADLHRLAPDALGLSGEPVSSPAEEIDRWSRTLETVDPALVPGWHDVRDELTALAPRPFPPAVVHGDFRLGNLLAVGENITAVIDWEIWSVGDPRIDAGWYLINSDPRTYSRPTPYVGATPSTSELTSVYSSVLGREIPDIEWFQALACFKSAATWSLIVKHNRRRSNPNPEMEAMAAVLPTLLAHGRQFLG